MVIRALIGSNDLEKAVTPETHSRVGFAKVGIERGGVELGESIYVIYVAVYAVADYCVDKSIVCCDRNGAF